MLLMYWFSIPLFKFNVTDGEYFLYLTSVARYVPVREDYDVAELTSVLRRCPGLLGKCRGATV